MNFFEKLCAVLALLFVTAMASGIVYGFWHFLLTPEECVQVRGVL